MELVVVIQDGLTTEQIVIRVQQAIMELLAMVLFLFFILFFIFVFDYLLVIEKQNKIKINKIKACNPTCETCSTGDSCLSCIAGLIYDNGQCVGSCPPGKYQSEGQCISCDSTCATCIGPTSNNCTSCFGNFSLWESSCLLSCPEGSWRNGQVCFPCHEDCATCYGGENSNCLICASRKILQNGICVSACDVNYYINGDTCLPCDSNCATCSESAIECSSCFENFVLLGTTCFLTCPHLSNEGNAEWNQTIANDQPNIGACINGFQGSVSRNCTQSGNWSEISGSCYGTFFFFFFFL